MWRNLIPEIGLTIQRQMAVLFRKSLPNVCSCGVACVLSLLPTVSAATAASSGKTVLGIKDIHFTLNGDPAFLLGISYYAALGAPQEFVLSDLGACQQYGFNWIRIWATGSWFGKDCSVVTGEGDPRTSKLAFDPGTGCGYSTIASITPRLFARM